MRHDDFEVPVEPHGEGMHGGVMPTQSETSIGDLFKRLGTDTAALVGAEVQLAKAEIREMGNRLVRDAARVGAAAGLAFVGVLSLSAFLVIALGNLLGGAYWLSALIVGGLAFAAGAGLIQSATNDIKKRGFKPEQTIATLREDKAWAGQQAKELRHDLTNDPTPPSRR